MQAKNTQVGSGAKAAGMSGAAKSVFVFGIYLVGMGVGLIAMPNLLLGTFGLPATSEVNIRIVGVLSLFIAYYYIQTARCEMTDFFRFTIPTRASLILFFGAFVALGFAPPQLLLLAPLDLLGAIWTALALRSAKT